MLDTDTQQQGQKPVEDPRILKMHLARYELQHKSASFRKERCEMLMRRKSAKKWTTVKKAQMVRKLMTANNEFEQATQAIEFVTRKLEGLIEMKTDATKHH